MPLSPGLRPSIKVVSLTAGSNSLQLERAGCRGGDLDAYWPRHCNRPEISGADSFEGRQELEILFHAVLVTTAWKLSEKFMQIKDVVYANEGRRSGARGRTRKLHG